MKQYFLTLLVGAVLAGAPALAQPMIDESAERILRAMSDYLGSATEFSFRAEIAFDEFSDWGQEVQYGGAATISARRPSGLHVDYSGDDRESQVIFDGSAVVFYDYATNLYATAEVAGGNDEAIDRLFELSGQSIPVADLLYSDPYAALSGSAEFGVALGRRTIGGKPAHHLAFAGEVLDWQIWIEDGPRPVPLQLVITYKEEPGAPQYRARFTHWDFDPRLSDHFFVFVPPHGADSMEFMTLPDFPVQEEVQP